MFEKFIGKRKKEADFFHIPEKKYTTDQKIIAKMSTSALKDLFNDQEKYVSQLVEKIENAKVQYDRLTDKVDELQEKNEVVNNQIARMTNEHEQLTIKFDNLQTSLEMFSNENDLVFKKELTFLNQQEINCEKLKNLNLVLNFYRERLTLCKKIEQQNKSLKGRYSELEEELEEAKTKLQQFEKQKSYNSLIPSLMKEIQELRENNAKSESKKQQELQNHLNKLEQNLVHKVKNELQTVSTLKTTEEEDFEQKNRITTLQLQRAYQEVQKYQERVKSLQQKNQDLIFNCGKSSQKILSLQSQLNKSKNFIEKLQQQISDIRLKYQNIEDKLNKQKSKSKDLENQLAQQKASGNNLQDFLAQINTVLESKQNECSKLHQQLQIKQQLIQSKQEQINRQKENRQSIENLLSNKNNSETDGLLKIKTKNQAEIQELRQTIDSLKRNISQNQTKIKQISDQLELLKTSNKRLVEEKQMIQENANNCLKISQEQAQKNKVLQKQIKKKNEQFKKQLQAATTKIKSKEDEIKNMTNEIQKLFKSLQTKDAQLKKNYSYIQQLEKEKSNINLIIGQKEEDNKIRIRKYESELNQQRIKLESLNRKINNLESKAEQSKASMDNMYEQLLSKDKKIVHMETKLKEYKYIIQVQKKEKQELQESYQKTISTLKPKYTQNQKEEPVEAQKQVKTASQKQIDHEKENLKNELLSVKEQNIVLLSENEGLRKKIEQLQDTIHQKSRNIKILQQKRDQIMKQIQKMNKKGSNISQPASSLHNLPSPSMIRIDTKENQGRQKKIAAKAHKGFDILLKLEHQFYKNFINIFATQLNRQEVKGIQGEINTIIKKSSDMKDIFEDYL